MTRHKRPAKNISDSWPIDEEQLKDKNVVKSKMQKNRFLDYYYQLSMCSVYIQFIFNCPCDILGILMASYTKLVTYKMFKFSKYRSFKNDFLNEWMGWGLLTTPTIFQSSSGWSTRLHELMLCAMTMKNILTHPRFEPNTWWPASYPLGIGPPPPPYIYWAQTPPTCFNSDKEELTPKLIKF